MGTKIDRNIKYQTFENFGASGAWWAQEVGGWTHTDKDGTISVRDKISRLLFSKTEGIGLDVYRYNIGAGSAHSGNGDIDNILRRTECFETSEGIYDFSRDANAVYMMKKAVEDGAGEVIFFVNSPIERLTKNSKSHNDKTVFFRDNIKIKNYKAFAKYCLDVTEHFINEGVPIKYLSPINEPIWIWMGGQEGCHYNPVSAGRVMKCFAEELEKRPNLKGLKLSGMESGDIRWFNKSYTRELLRYDVVRRNIDSIDIHSYCLPLPIKIQPPFYNDRIGYIKRYRKWLDKHYPDVPVKMSEWTHMQGGRDRTIDSALVTANTIYEDISLLNVTSWQHWIAVSEVDYCDGLIYINLDSKTYEMTKRYYATGNFSKYIPKGSKRINIKSEDDSLKMLAFDSGDRITVIVINDTYSRTTISLDGFSGKARQIVTSKTDNLKEYETDCQSITILARSVNTIII